MNNSYDISDLVSLNHISKTNDDVVPTIRFGKPSPQNLVDLLRDLFKVAILLLDIQICCHFNSEKGFVRILDSEFYQVFKRILLE